MRILIAEDDGETAEFIRRGLDDLGHHVLVAANGTEALRLLLLEDLDLAVIDRMLPSLDGLSVVRRARVAEVETPVLLLTALGRIQDRVEGLDAGADDYLVKPFAFAELLARLRALARRGTQERPTVLEVDDLKLDPATRRVWRGQSEIQLSAKEFSLLEAFMRRPDEVLSRVFLLDHAWDFAYENRSNVVDVYIRHLRSKIDEPFGCRTLETIRGAGYRLRANGNR
jgi:two-component system OmpR family response regulator